MTISSVGSTSPYPTQSQPPKTQQHQQEPPSTGQSQDTVQLSSQALAASQDVDHDGDSH